MIGELLPGYAPAEPALLDEPLTERLLGEEERTVRERVRAVVTAEVAPRAAEWDRTRTFAAEGYQALAGAGLAGLIFPRAYGGRESTTLAYAVAMEEIAAACGSTALIYMTQMHAGYPILIAGTEEQRRRYLPDLCAGTTYGSLAISEPEAGSDVAAMRTTARRDGDAYVLDGGKTFITTGDRADVIVAFASVDRTAGRRGITAFIVPGDAPGLSRGRTLSKMGMHGSSTAELFFSGLRLPESARLGEEGEGWSLSMRSVVKSRISAAAQGLGLARGAYGVGLGWARATGALGRGGRQDVEFRLADLRARIASARLLLYSVAAQLDAGNEDEAAAGIAMMKFTCTDLGLAAADEVVDLLGPLGDLAELGAERRLRDAKVTQIYDGTNQVQRLLLARDTARRVAAYGEGT